MINKWNDVFYILFIWVDILVKTISLVNAEKTAHLSVLIQLYIYNVMYIFMIMFVQMLIIRKLKCNLYYSFFFLKKFFLKITIEKWSCSFNRYKNVYCHKLLFWP